MAELTYQLTEAQFLDAQRLHASLKPWWARLLLYFVSLAGLALLGLGLYYGNHWLALGGLVYALLPISSFRLITRPMARRSYRRSPSLREPNTVALRDGQLQLHSARGGGSLPWEHIIHWAEDERSLLLYLQPRLFLVLPKAADTRPCLIAPLREQLLAHVGTPRS